MKKDGRVEVMLWFFKRMIMMRVRRIYKEHVLYSPLQVILSAAPLESTTVWGEKSLSRTGGLLLQVLFAVVCVRKAEQTKMNNDIH